MWFASDSHYHLTCDGANRLLLLSKRFVRVGERGESRCALWRRTRDGTWTDLGFVRDGSAEWAALATLAPGRSAVAYGTTKVFFRTYSDARGWSDQVRIESHLRQPLHPSIARLPEGRCVVAYGSKDGIVARVCEAPSDWSEQDED